MKIYYEEDANIEIIQSLNVSIIGYGSQGPVSYTHLRAHET